jgi:colanic acid biosynthesis glycosyl transferase WcaI
MTTPDQNPKYLLLVTQVYVPDPASVGQHMADAAEEMAMQGWHVRVLTSNRGYDNAGMRFARSEIRNGVHITRLPFTSLGKRAIWHRLLGQLSFCLQSVTVGLLGTKPSLLLITTSPPMGSVVGVLLSWLRRIPVAWWVMDINPDQALATGNAKPGSVTVRIFDFFNRQVLRQAQSIVALDRFMAATVTQKEPNAARRIHILPPWPHESHLQRVEHATNPFRAENGLDGKFVVMYSGNHSPVHPLTTLLDAAMELADDPRLVFLFIGGGAGKRQIDELIRRQSPPNIRSIPYQPLDRIRYSLSAADLHVVSMGPAMVGIVHPCKFYGAMALAKPILYIGPQQSHVGEIIQSAGCGWRVDHGDVAGMVGQLRACAAMPTAELDAIGANGKTVIESSLGEQILRPQFANLIQGINIPTKISK